MKLYARWILLLCAALACRIGAAQTVPTTGTLVSKERIAAPTRTTTRTVSAVVIAVNAAARSVSLGIVADGATAPGETVAATLDTACQPLKNSRPATLADFAPGERVVARLTWRTAPEKVVVVRDLYDPGSFAERQKNGKDICVGTVEQFSATELSVARADGSRLAFRVTDKTRLIKDDAPASVAAFGVGAPVAVKPRRLPGGSLMASFVGGTTQDVLWAYRDGLTTWSGVVTSVVGSEKIGATVQMKRDDGAVRQFSLAVGAPFTQGRNKLAWGLLSGATITAHLVKGAAPGTLRTADSVKIASRRATKSIGVETTEEP